MKTRSFSLLTLVLASLLASSVTAASAEKPAKAFRVASIEQHNQPALDRGTSEFTVRRLLGEPWRKLDANNWVYERYAAADWKIETDDCSALLITFVDGKVADILLVNEGAKKNIAANLQKHAAPTAVAAK